MYMKFLFKVLKSIFKYFIVNYKLTIDNYSQLASGHVVSKN